MSGNLEGLHYGQIGSALQFESLGRVFAKLRALPEGRVPAIGVLAYHFIESVNRLSSIQLQGSPPDEEDACEIVREYERIDMLTELRFQCMFDGTDFELLRLHDHPAVVAHLVFASYIECAIASGIEWLRSIIDSLPNDEVRPDNVLRAWPEIVERQQAATGGKWNAATAEVIRIGVLKEIARSWNLDVESAINQDSPRAKKAVRQRRCRIEVKTQPQDTFLVLEGRDVFRVSREVGDLFEKLIETQDWVNLTEVNCRSRQVQKLDKRITALIDKGGTRGYRLTRDAWLD